MSNSIDLCTGNIAGNVIYYTQKNFISIPVTNISSLSIIISINFADNEMKLRLVRNMCKYLDDKNNIYLRELER